jgi:hypothetical protein
MGVNQTCEAWANLQMMLMSRFCIFFKNKTVNYHMQGARGQAGHVTQKFIDGGVPVSGRSLFVKVNFVKVESRFSKSCGIYSSGNKFYKADWVFFEGNET